MSFTETCTHTKTKTKTRTKSKSKSKSKSRSKKGRRRSKAKDAKKKSLRVAGSASTTRTDTRTVSERSKQSKDRELEYHDAAAFAAKFEVGTKINEGGFGSVWRVRSKSPASAPLQRQCVKIMELGHDEKSFARRKKGCLREFSMTHRAFADEPAAVELFMDATDTSSATKVPKAYLVMPYFCGKDLFEFIDDADYQRTVSDALILHIFYKMTEKLYDLHYFKNIVHGDLKPENVMILENGSGLDGLEVEIIDYGIAK